MNVGKTFLPLLLLRTVNSVVRAQLTCSSKPLFFVKRNFAVCTSNMSYKPVERGDRNTSDYKVYYEGPNGVCSPWHDIPLYDDKDKQIFNMVVEIPRWTNAKMEMSTKGKLNFIKQDVKKGALRYVKNVFPHHGYIWNYGAFPQTWEDPNEVSEHTNAKGDNDPLDVCEIGDTVHPRGAVIQVKVLGIMAMIDEGETDWKVLVIDVNDPMASKINDVDDIKTHKPGLLEATYEWFVLYKLPDGKPKNTFAFNGEAKNREFALKIISETSEQWRKLVKKEIDSGGLDGSNVSVEDSPFRITQEEANKEIDSSSPPAEDHPLPPDVDKMYFVS